jgi:hypothetical protein
VTVFLFDELNTKLTDQEFAKKEFLRYLRELPADSRAAVFALGDSLSLLHDFSQDMASLLAADREAQESRESGSGRCHGAACVGQFAHGRPEDHRAVG